MLGSKASFAFINLFSPPNNPSVRYNYLPFADEDTEAQRSKATFPDHRMQVRLRPEPGWRAGYVYNHKDHTIKDVAV